MDKRGLLSCSDPVAKQDAACYVGQKVEVGLRIGWLCTHAAAKDGLSSGETVCCGANFGGFL